jgi:hypothetical protein
MQKVIFFIIILSFSVVGLWKIKYSSSTWRYKMTVEVETPEGIKTGSAVREISMVSRQPLLGESNDTHVKLEKGEAVVVDLEERGVLFALLQGNGMDAVQIFFRAFPSPCKEGAVSRCGLRYYSSLSVGKKTKLASRDYPMFVTFENLNDPKSVKSVLEIEPCTTTKTDDPDKSDCISNDRLTEFFGQEVSLRSVVLEVTSAKVDFSIHRILPWINDYYDKRLDGKRFGTAKSKYKLANRLSSGSFSTGVKK